MASAAVLYWWWQLRMPIGGGGSPNILDFPQTLASEGNPTPKWDVITLCKSDSIMLVMSHVDALVWKQNSMV